MKKSFYPKLAFNNLRKNKSTVIPFVITCVLTITMFYMMSSLALNDTLANMKLGVASMIIILHLGTIVIGLFAVIFLFYTYSFLMKRRKKEFGLYNILGMDKKHISHVLTLETLYIAIFSLIVGIGLGIIFNKLMFMLLLKLMHIADLGFDFAFPIEALINTLILFAVIFTLMLLNTIRQIHVSKPIELLRGSNTGEKEPKTKWLLAIIGVLCLGGGYYISVSTQDPMAIISLFFLAVILVIIGTYCLFTAVSIALLKAMRKNKKFYYKTNHFVAISGMIYRMKQNAVGLANICILSTMVLVMLSSTICLYSGSQDVLSKMYTSDFTMTTNNDISDGIYNKELDMANKVLSENNLTAADITRERYLYLYGERTENSFKANAASQTSMDDRTAVLIIIPLSDYKQMDKNCNISLKDNEAIACSKKGSFDEDSFSVDNQTFKIVNRVDSVNDSSYMTAQMIDTTYLIVNDTKLIDTLSGAKNGVLNTNDVLSGFVLAQELRFNINGDEATQYKIYDQLCNAFSDLNTNGYVGCNAESTVQFYSIYGGLFFIGIFLGALFIMAAVLIMYYKQISEGYDDKERFQIMQKVGMSKAEIKKSINSQVLMVFFLPLIVAIIHIAFAFPAITKLLSAIAMTNTPLFIICTGASIVGFAVIYAIVYALTAKSYYKIVE